MESTKTTPSLTPRRLTFARLAGTFTALAGLLVLIGCGSTGPESTIAPTSDVAAVAVGSETDDNDQDDNDQDEGRDAESADESTAATETTPTPDIIRTTASDVPWDLTGGATSSSDGVVVTDENPTEQLVGFAREATAPWPTDWTRATIDLSELATGLQYIDPRDGIPPIDNPAFESATQAAEWLLPAEPGALVEIDGDARFYPLSIMTRHEIINDRFDDVPVAVTYCPLCNTALAFDRRVDGEVLRFGVSGLLRKSDLVMWDDKTTSLWQQITGDAIVGTYAGTQLDPLSTRIVSFEQFAEAFPDGLSLAQRQAFGIRYGSNPYVGYSSRTSPLPFFTEELDDRLPALERVVGVTVEDEDVAYAFSALTNDLVVNDTIADTPVAIFWGPGTTDALDGSEIASSREIGTAIAYDPRNGDQVLTFVAEGDDFRDNETGSLWTLLGQAIDGPLAGQQLDTMTHRNEFWFAWASFFPEGVLHAP